MTRPFPIRPSALLLAALFTLGACSSSPTAPIVCDASARAGITVTIKDAETLVPLAATARGVVRDGAYVDSLMLVAPDTRVAAFERAGTYSVEVRLTGYQNFTASGVRVTAGTCHVNAVVVPALLLKLRS
ncbi:hypothetical protein [Gemmatimonas sp.]|jgi:hypothetical protein|uniref:hypothetical protein n=1 Tax=Gemmatimonas sp. TaxID=1962908 RepID=UPI0037BF5E97